MWDGISDQERVLPNLLQLTVVEVGSVALVDDLLQDATVDLTAKCEFLGVIWRSESVL